MNYNVLLILTDGNILDMPQTRQRLVDLSKLPCSVIIVGLGDEEDFELMEELDGDDVKLTDDDDKECERDIVQFVEYEKAIKEGELGERVLEEIPQ